MLSVRSHKEILSFARAVKSEYKTLYDKKGDVFNWPTSPASRAFWLYCFNAGMVQPLTHMETFLCSTR